MPSGSSRPAQSVFPSGSPQAPTRERILAYLEQNHIVSVIELSRTWGLTRADIRYHFNSLEADGMIERVPRKRNQPAQRGRPVQQYRLAAGPTTGNLVPLCAVLLDTLFCSMSVEEREPALRALAARLAGSDEVAPGMIQRLNSVCAFLNPRGYQARWEAHVNGPHILLRSCPYVTLLPAHPELCELDRLLLEQLVQVPWQQIARINPEGRKPAACIFTIQYES